MRKLLHTNSKITFPNPYVVRVRCKDPYSVIPIDSEVDFIQLRRRARQMFTGATWAYSTPAIEEVHLSAPQPILQIGSIFSLGARNVEYQQISYWVFSDEQDALQFQLMFGHCSKQVLMWPEKTLFTITEYTE